MVQKLNRICERFNSLLGITVTLPNPGKKLLWMSTVCNFIVGMGLIAAGLLFPSKRCAILGGIGIASSVVMRWEAMRKADEG